MKARLAILVCVFAALASAQGTPVAAGDSHPTVAAWKGTVRNVVERQGTFVPAEAAELKLDLKSYKGELKFTEILPHGSFVNEGDIIARLDTKGIDEQIERGRMALERAEMGMRHAEEELRMSSERDAEKLAAAQRSADRAAKKLRGYREYEKKFTEESERMSIQSWKHRLEDQKDELDQLEKMYAEDELVDATEEIVLKRSRRNYARSVASRELSDRRRVYNKEWYEAWREEDYETDANKKAEALKRLQRAQAMGREKTDENMKQKRYDLQKQREKFAELQRDREQFVVRAPRRGILLHGAPEAAPWGRLQTGSSVRNGMLWASIADPKKYKVKTNIPEADILKVKSGSAAEAEPTAMPDRKMVGRISVDYLPGKGGLFDAEVALGGADVRLRPGLTCKIAVILEEERDVVLIPKTALIEKDSATVVRCAKTKDGPFEERTVVTGVSDDENVAIRDGLAVGEYVVVPPAKPGDQQRPNVRRGMQRR